MSTRNLIDAIASGSALDIESAFEDTMAEKVSVQIEAKRLQIAQTMFTTEEVDLDEEQLDELSPKTLGSYVKKASKSVGNISTAAGTLAGGTDETRKSHWGSLLKNKAANRQKNISKAVNKLVHKANEEVDLDEEQLDELSPKTLGSYVKKATSSNDARSISNLSSKAAYKLATSGDGEDEGEEEDKKSYTRSKGIARAVNKLTKEEVEEQSEQE